MFVIIAVNFYVATSILQLKKAEAAVNAFCNVIHPAYVDLYFLVSIFKEPIIVSSHVIQFIAWYLVYLVLKISLFL